MRTEVIHNPEEQRYKIWADDELAGLRNTTRTRARWPSSTPRSTTSSRGWVSARLW